MDAEGDTNVTSPHDFESQVKLDETLMPSPMFRCMADGVPATGIYRPRHDDVLVQVDGEERIDIRHPTQVRSLIGGPLYFNTLCDRTGCSNTKPAGTPTCWCASCY